MFHCLALDLCKKFGDFLVFDRNYFFQAVEFDTKDFSLILKILFDVLQFEVYHLLKFLFNSAYFFIFLLNHFSSLLFFILNHISKPRYFLIFFFSDFLDPP
jgi:hypothetical protein